MATQKLASGCTEKMRRRDETQTVHIFCLRSSSFIYVCGLRGQEDKKQEEIKLANKTESFQPQRARLAFFLKLFRVFDLMLQPHRSLRFWSLCTSLHLGFRGTCAIGPEMGVKATFQGCVIQDRQITSSRHQSISTSFSTCLLFGYIVRTGRHTQQLQESLLALQVHVSPQRLQGAIIVANGLERVSS